MSEPEEITYQRWWAVFPARGAVEEFTSEEEAVRRAVQLLKAGVAFVNITVADRPKP